MVAPASKTFEYAVRDRSGKIIKGRVEASNQAAVANRLREMGLAAVSINEVSTSGLQREITIPGMGEKVGLKDLAVMSRQMATMISAGLSLLRTLSILAEQTESKPLAKVLGTVRSDVETGGALSVALAKHREVFPPLMINIIRAGEVGGFLEKALISVADNYEAEVKLRGKIKSAMAYPTVVFFIAIIAVAVMLIFIVPVFKNMFEGLGGELPLPTQMLVWFSSLMRWLGPVLVVAIIVFMSWWKKHKNDDKVRQLVDPWRLRLPVFGALSEKIAIARFSRNFGTMMASGVPLLQALDIVGEVSGNWVIEAAIRDVQESVRRGESLTGPLGKHEVFPSMVTQMMAVGEDSGSLETMLEKISEFYDQEVEATTEQLTSLIEPIMILGIGLVVGGMIVALYLPIFNVFNLIG
ncbi:type II secretion system F family protein [Cellulomonas uda]|uniref:Type II secretion system protein F n=1 Tax=Cellulomonas uda TaxID=1714 RepID=A0A4Y3KE86_CELUD|nr:type II secretion system F family protein [Cellulomonas uda]NII65934.1 type IV pilus assembly protein PilC [Cellulomonas uda]GEA82273.1 type II secretion system protein F [Cellulomonas uda]